MTLADFPEKKRILAIILAWLGLLSIKLTKIKSSLQFAQFCLGRTITIRDFFRLHVDEKV